MRRHAAAELGYLHAHTPFADELRRLQLLEARYDDITFGRLAQFGDLAGLRCLEVGAGAGSVTRWLSGKVGDAGQVVAVDVDPRFLTDHQGGNVEVRRHDILLGPPEDIPAFDLVHCRAVLIHLDDPARAVAAMTAALRPGGHILLEDADLTAMCAADPLHPASAGFDRVLAVMWHHFAANRSLVPNLGRRLVPLARRAGLADARHEAIAAVQWGGSMAAEFLLRSTPSTIRHLTRDRLLDAADLAGWHSALSDPGFCFYDPLLVAVWARRDTM
jgi:2-polyprenyl-3-methyl-5-hydroxy-6-metoxy-1,4-benzoquinol methylase